VKKRKKGDGGIYQRGKIWWITYRVNGEKVFESSKSEKDVDARKLLSKRMGEMATGVYVGPDAEKVTMAELAAGPHATSDPEERARRQDRLQRTEATFEALPVDGAVARAYGRIYAAIAATGRKARGPRAFDLLIAATAVAAELPLYTRNPSDFAGLGGLVDVVAV